MRPTPRQVYCNITFFTQLLEEAGVENAQAKMASLHFKLINWNNIKSWHETYLRDLRSYEQSFDQKPNRSQTEEYKRKERLRLIKRCGSCRRSVIAFRQRAEIHQKIIENKIAKWPELEYDESKLSKQYDSKAARGRLKKRASRKRILWTI